MRRIFLFLVPVLLLTGCNSSNKSEPASVGSDSPYSNEQAVKPLATSPGQNQPVSANAVDFVKLSRDGYLVGIKDMTLYTFKKDAQGKSNCVDKCAVNWPPLEPMGELKAGAGVTGALGIITRPNGVSQVTYNDMPLYYWINDKVPGDTTGDGVNGTWFIAKP